MLDLLRTVTTGYAFVITKNPAKLSKEVIEKAITRLCESSSNEPNYDEMQAMLEWNVNELYEDFDEIELLGLARLEFKVKTVHTEVV